MNYKQIADIICQLCGKNPPRLQVSFSGGGTSAYMSEMTLPLRQWGVDVRYIFANTGREHPDTLRFVNDVDKHLGLGVVWVEAVVHPGKRKATTHRIVDYETACRNGDRFHEVVDKYGLPSQVFKLCTRELKLNPMYSYMDTIWKRGTYQVAIGIRADEMRRVAPTAAVQNILYPLVDWWPTTKQDVLDHWEDRDYGLQIEEYQGNCIDCHRKSDSKLLKMYQTDPAVFEFPVMLDRLYENTGPNYEPGPRRRYRHKRSTQQLLASFENLKDVDATHFITDGGCSESCEVYETEVVNNSEHERA